MGVVSRGGFERLLGSLDEAAFTAFVADLWSARGHETAVEGRRVVAADGTVVLCVPSRRGRRSPLDERVADADVVATADPRPPRDRSERARVARVLGPEELRGMLLYGVDRRTASDLFEGHFGRPLADAEPPTKLSHQLSTVSRRSMVGVALFAVIAVSLAVASGAGYGSLPGDAQEAAVPPMTVPSSTPGPTPDRAFEPPPAGGSLFRYPPGIGPSGVTDAAALAAAHREAVAPTPWDLLLIYRGSTDVLNPHRRWIGSRQTVDRSTDARYWYRVTGLARTGGDAFETVIYDDFGDDSFNYRRTAGPPAPGYHRSRLPTVGGDGVFTAVSAAYVRRYLATTESRVEVLEFGATNRYRVVATGTPAGIAGPVENYTAVAIVDRRGLVAQLTVEFTRPVRLGDGTPVATPPPVLYPAFDPADTPGTVRFRMVFRDVGDATVEVPAWYQTARNTTNGTAVGPWPNDPTV